MKVVNVVKDQLGLRRRSREARKGVQREGKGFRGVRERGLRRRKIRDWKMGRTRLYSRLSLSRLEGGELSIKVNLCILWKSSSPSR